MSVILIFLMAGVLFGSVSIARATDPVSDVQAIITEANTQSVTISWKGLENSDASYRIYRSTYSGSNGSILFDRLNSQTYIDTTVVYNTTYYYRVSAILGETESAISSQVSVKPTLPVPINVKAVDTGQGKEIKISWDRPTLELPLKYKVYRASNDTSNGSSLTSNLDAVEYFDKTASNGTAYYYRIRSVYGTSIESDPSEAVWAKASDTVPPAQPTNVRASLSSGNKASISWSAPANESSLKYLVYRSSSPSDTGNQITETTATSYTDTVPAGISIFYYRVKAFDQANNQSMASDSAVINTASSTIATTTKQYKVTEFSAGGTLNVGEIQLRWKLPSYSGISFARIYRRLDGTDTKSMIANKVYGSSYLDKNIQAGKKYYYFIRLVDKNGYEYEASTESGASSFVEKSTGTIISNTTNQNTKPVTPKATTTKSSVAPKTNNAYAYGRPRMTNLKLETALANDLRAKLVKQLGAKKVPRKLNSMLIRAYLYGGYSVAEIADTIINGPGLVHPTILAFYWRESDQYQSRKK